MQTDQGGSLLTAALSARSGHLWAVTARAIGQVGDAHATAVLLTLLSDSRVSVRRSAVWALCRVGDVRAAEPLLVLLEEGSRPQRRAAVVALGRGDDARAIQLLGLAEKDQDRSVVAASKALDRLRSDAAPALVSASGKVGMEVMRVRTPIASMACIWLACRRGISYTRSCWVIL